MRVYRVSIAHSEYLFVFYLNLVYFVIKRQFSPTYISTLTETNVHSLICIKLGIIGFPLPQKYLNYTFSYTHFIATMPIAAYIII